MLYIRFGFNKDGSGLNKRYVDRAFLAMMKDARLGGIKPIWLVNKKLFGEDEDAPLVDENQTDKELMICLLVNRS